MKFAIVALFLVSSIGSSLANPLDHSQRQSVKIRNELFRAREACMGSGCCTCDGGYVVACCVSHLKLPSITNFDGLDVSNSRCRTDAMVVLEL
jgi:hypothetical protein